MAVPVANRVLGIDSAGPWNWLHSMRSKHGAIDLGMGNSDMDPPDFVSAALESAAGDLSLSQYPKQDGGIPRLIESLTTLYSGEFERTLMEENFLVTQSAYASLTFAMLTYINPGDEVIIIQPFFNAFENFVKLAGGVPVYNSLVPVIGPDGLETGWRLDGDALTACVTPRTRAILLNTPHNPTGKIFSRAELLCVSDLCTRHQLLCVSDEVYEWMVFPGQEHVRVATLPGMWKRTLTICSAGKTFGVTGWRLGWVVSDSDLLQPLALAYSSTVSVTSHVIMQAVALCVEHCISQCTDVGQEAAVEGGEERTADGPAVPVKCSPREVGFLATQGASLQSNFDVLASAFRRVGIHAVPCQGTYFMLINWRSSERVRRGVEEKLSKKEGKITADDQSVKDLEYDTATEWFFEHGLAVILMTPFYAAGSLGAERAYDYFRLCFCRSKACLDAAVDRLTALCE